MSTSSKAAPFERIDPSYLVEEESLSFYRPQDYYPVKLGDVYHNGRYKVIGKLGFGSSSTVWLCKDLQPGQTEYVALKIYINNSKYHRELPIYEEMNNISTTRMHGGRNYIGKMYDSFELPGLNGRNHICLVQQPLGTSLSELKDLCEGGVLPMDIIRPLLRCVLLGLQFLHAEVRIIHTDLQPANVLLGIHDTSILAQFERDESQHPCPRKELDDRTIYMSRPMRITKGPPHITDFSEARDGVYIHTDKIMPSVYRAPEVILGMPWSYPVDIWGFGMVLWDLFQPERLFAHQNGVRYSEAHHLAKMVAVMGPPPLQFLRRCGPKADQYWDRDGTWKGETPIPNITLEQMDQRLEGEDKQRFIVFMRKMLQWNPDDRHDIDSVYIDEWFLGDLIESGAISRDDMSIDETDGSQP